jgi:hypothetical protein
MEARQGMELLIIGWIVCCVGAYLLMWKSLTFFVEKMTFTHIVAIAVFSFFGPISLSVAVFIFLLGFLILSE